MGIPFEQSVIQRLMFSGRPAGVSSRLIYNFDGVDDYITVPTLTLITGDVIEYSFKSPSIAPPFFEKLLVSSINSTILETAFSKFRTAGHSVLLDGIPVVFY